MLNVVNVNVSVFLFIYLKMGCLCLVYMAVSDDNSFYEQVNIFFDE